MRKFLENGHNDGENTHFMLTVINRSPNANHSLTLSLKNFFDGPIQLGEFFDFAGPYYGKNWAYWALSPSESSSA